MQQQAMGAGSGGSGPKPPDSMKVMRAAIRALRYRLDRVGRKMSALNDENQTLSNRLTSLRMENAKLHQALEKERTRLKNIVDGGPLAPSDRDVITDIWLPAGGRTSSLADAVTPSTSSASLDAILSPRRLLPSRSSPQPQVVAPLPLSFFNNVTIPRSATSFQSLQDASDDPLLICTDLFDDGTSEDSLTTHAASTKASSSVDAVPSTSTARAPTVTGKPSNSGANTGGPGGSGLATLDSIPSMPTTEKEEDSSPGSSGSCKPTERKRKKTCSDAAEDGQSNQQQQEDWTDQGERSEPKYSMSSSSLD